MKLRGIFAKTNLLATAGLIAVSLSGAASAAETFNFNGSNINSSNSAGNVRTFTGNDGTKVEVSGYAYDGSTLYTGFVGQYSGYGLGLEHSQSDNSHTVDNSGFVDFLVLQFDHAVTVSKLGIYGFGDTDLAWAVGTTGVAFNSTLSFANMAAVTSLFGSFTTSNGNDSSSLVSRSVNGSALTGNVFLVAAAPNSDGNDKFKLKSAKATTPLVAPVPEPASWALMITGFALVGGTMRRRANQSALRFA